MYLAVFWLPVDNLNLLVFYGGCNIGLTLCQKNLGTMMALVLDGGNIR